jgi:hypothetical protein
VEIEVGAQVRTARGGNDVFEVVEVDADGDLGLVKIQAIGEPIPGRYHFYRRAADLLRVDDQEGPEDG